MQMDKIAESVFGIVFMGTPHCGSEKADWAQVGINILGIFRKGVNRMLTETLQPGSQILEHTHNEFMKWLNKRQAKGKKIEIATIVLFSFWLDSEVVFLLKACD